MTEKRPRDFNLREAKQMLQDGALLLDIRSTPEYCEGHLCGAVQIPTPVPPFSKAQHTKMIDRLFRHVRFLPKNYPIVVYCKKGLRASMARSFLERVGFTNVVVLGGVSEQPMKSLFDKSRKDTFLRICKCV